MTEYTAMVFWIWIWGKLHFSEINPIREKNCTGGTVLFCQYSCNWTQSFCQQSLESKIKTFQPSTKRTMWENSVEWLLLSENTEFRNQKRKIRWLCQERCIYQCNNLNCYEGVIKEKKSTDKLLVQILLCIAQKMLEMARVPLLQQRRKRSLLFFFLNGSVGFAVNFTLKYTICVCLWRIKDKRLGKQSAFCNIKLKQYPIMHKDGFQEEIRSTDANFV